MQQQRPQRTGTHRASLFVRLDDIVEFFRTNPRASLHIVLIGAALLEIILGTVSFIVTRAMIKNKLNLE